ncbi:MAG TPA: hypothetical protein VFA65_07695 [Bryobacteraceae bacterium]|nr:hypothetical protein [Bryobacteraceae bacterium]
MKTKSTSQRGRKLTNRAVLLIVVAFAVCAFAAVACAELRIPTTSWIGANGSWFVAGNWSNGVPSSSKSADINNGGTANINSTGATACNLILGYNSTQSGTVSINGGSLAVTNEVEVGAFGRGTLTITNGATVTAGLLTIAALHGASDSVGTVTVDAGTFTINTRADVGGDNGTPGGVALLTVKNGGIVSASNLRVYGSGTLTGNSTVSTSSGTTIDGTIAPSGTLTVGGSLTFSGTAATMQSKVVPAGADNVSVSGAATLTGRLSVTMTGTFTPGTTYTLLHCDGPRNGTFATQSINYPTGQCFTPVITYDAHNVYLYLQPNCL